MSAYESQSVEYWVPVESSLREVARMLERA